MARISVGSPWEYGFVGLGEGILSGLEAGENWKNHRQKAEAERVRQAIDLLQAGIKAGEVDPAMGQQMVAAAQKLFPGIPAPTGPWQTKTDRDIAESKKLAGALGIDPRQLYGIKPEGEQIDVDLPDGRTIKVPAKEAYRYFPELKQAPGWTFGPNMEQIPLAPGYKTPPAIFRPEKPEKPEKTKEMSAADKKYYNKLIDQAEAKNTEKEGSEEYANFERKRQRAIEELEAAGGKVTRGGGEEKEVPTPGVGPWLRRFAGSNAPDLKTKIKTPTTYQAGMPPLQRPTTAGPGGRGGQQVYQSLPDPALFAGKIAVNPTTGERYKSDGTKWNPVK